MKGYESVLGYVFVRGATTSDLDAMQALPGAVERVHAVARVAGSYDAFVAVVGETLQDIVDTVQTSIRSSGIQTETAVAMATVQPPGGVTWVPPSIHVAFCRVVSVPGRAEEVMRAIATQPGTLGVVTVAGAFDVFAEVGASSFQELIDRLARVNATPGVVSTDSAFAVDVVSDESAHPAQA